MMDIIYALIIIILALVLIPVTIWALSMYYVMIKMMFDKDYCNKVYKDKNNESNELWII